MFAPIAVYGTLSLAGWLCLPLVARVLPAAADRGAGVARVLVLFGAGWLSWLLAAGGMDRAAFWLGPALLLLAGLAGWWRWRRELLPWLRARWRLLLAVELTGLLVYSGLLVFRGWTADITTIEKYTNLAVINSIVLVPQVPPLNAWSGGLPLNYYYLGHWTLAMVSQVSGLPPNDLVIYATPLLAAICAQGAFSIVGALVEGGRVGWSLLAGFVLLLCGSFTEAVYGLADWQAEWQRDFFASQLPPPLVDALAPYGNLFEFPAVSIVQGEMHAHFLGVPLLVGLLALLAQRFSAPAQRGGLAWYVVGAVLVGSGYAVNSWQYPTMLALWLLVEWWAWLRGGRGPLTRPLLASLLMVGVSVLALLPFWLTFETFASPLLPGVDLQPVPLLPGDLLVWSPVGTSLWGLFLTLGLPLGLAGLAALALLGRAGWRWLALALLLGALSALYRPVGLVLLPLAAAGLWLSAASERPLAAGGLLLACGALLALACEYVMIPDHTFSRSNTIFKFYLQVWVLLAFAAPLLLAGALHQREARPGLRVLLVGGLVLALLAGSVFPVLRGRQWVRYHGDRWWGLNAMAQVRSYHPHEAAAIEWLRQQPGTGGVLETIASSTDGTDTRLRPAHFSALTGRPTPRGWSGHTAQWSNYRASQQTRDRFENTGKLVLDFPETQSINDIYVLMRLYNLDYVAYGHFEQREWGRAGLRLLQEHLPLRWQAGDVRLFGRPADLPETLVWLHPLDWGNQETTTDGTDTPFHWMLGQRGQISIYSERPALVQLRFEPISSTQPGTLSVWQAEHRLLEMPVLPYYEQTRLLWLPVRRGTTTLEVRTDVPPVAEAERSITVAIKPPRLTLLPTRE